MNPLAVMRDEPVARATDDPLVVPDLFPPGAVLSQHRLILPPGMAFAEWQRLGRKLIELERSMSWWLGDWAAYGEATYGESYAQAIGEETGYAVETVRTAQWVAEKVAPERRRIDTLSFSHHRAVASLEPDEQTVYLDKAEADGLTSKQLYELVHPDRQERAVTLDVAGIGEDDVKQTLRPWLAGRDLIEATEAVMVLLAEKGIVR